MLICFYVAKAIDHHEFVPAGTKIKATFYLSVLRRLLYRIRGIRPEAPFPIFTWSGRIRLLSVQKTSFSKEGHALC